MAEREQTLSRHTTHAVTGFSTSMIKTKALKNFVAAGAAALLLLAATPVWAADAAVKIGNFTFGPQELKVKAGATITWTNEDDIPHTVVSPNNFRSKVLDTEGTYSFTFITPGTYKYFCSLHPHMTGTIVVEAATGSIAQPQGMSAIGPQLLNLTSNGDPE
jgi:plastocyanin